ncbi:CZB domain-containing protein [Neptunomonas japonica]|uniref:Methyl-accepting chemotaxis protein n=1 Tax=Neptunomonas japonica JAMM 1380 TaxID=1441457 RepID=A0A7R6PUW1_9GAMM|nr:CZB domain-containing protein [Neptunomonas japonica]BBB29968.1 methyl-accepting chemotaxis protein [Neptunomonas japonica JAMM 1380]
MSLANLFQNNSRVLTFTIANSHFGIDARNILSFSDEYKHIQLASHAQHPSFLGYLDYRDTLINVYDSATLLNRKRNWDDKNQLIADIDTYKQAHIDWVQALERSITFDESFTLARDPKMCAFGQWFCSFKTEDADLLTALEKIDKPHQLIHQLADTLLEMKNNGDAERAIRLLSIEKGTTLKKLVRSLEQISGMLKREMHPVIIHLTLDGKTPSFSLALDEVDDIIDYEIEDLDTGTAQALSHEPLKGYLRHKSGQRYMMLCVEKLSTQIRKISSFEDCIS